MTQALILIPARFQSTRFPGKPLAKIGNKTMIQTVYENCRESGAEVCVVTDSPEIERHILGFGGQVCRVDDDVPSGSVRISLAYERFFQRPGDQRAIINVQGDEPLLPGSEVKRLCEFHLSSDYDIATFVRPRREGGNTARDPHVVKVIYSEVTKKCHYFSRSPIPYVVERDGETGGVPGEWYQHIGIYSYRPDSLLAFAKASSSYYENAEKLEQLRVLDLNLSIGAIKTELNLISVDRPEDILKIEGVLGGST